MDKAILNHQNKTYMENQIEIKSLDYQQANSISQTIELLSVRKFVILSVVTMGLYPLWWNYKAWQFIERYKSPGISPAFRTLFGIFFLFSLLRQILTMAGEKGYASTYSPLLLFMGVLGIEIVSIFSPYFMWLACFETILFIAPFKALNYTLRNAEYVTCVEQPEAFNTRQVVLLVLGVIGWICLPIVFIV